MYYETTLVVTVKPPEIMPLSVVEPAIPVPKNTWYVDGSSRGKLCVWIAVAIQPHTTLYVV